jgi:hypothetical protein
MCATKYGCICGYKLVLNIHAARFLAAIERQETRVHERARFDLLAPGVLKDTRVRSL